MDTAVKFFHIVKHQICIPSICLLDKIPLLGNISDTRCALRWCKLVSRLDLNWRKSDVFGVGMLIICFISWTPAVVTQLVSNCIR